MAEPGTVYLVGAGPGDPGLITVKGLQLLREADVVVCDRLVNPDLLKEMRAGAEMIRIHEGKRWRAAEQEEINQLLIAHARQRKSVVRLKGGDPFLFGRGGEEADALAAAGIPFEVVPGVTSALAVPAYAGIPVTDRRAASSLRIVTGRSSRPPRLSEAGSSETVVALMSVEVLPEVVAGLLETGWAPGTPAALIEKGTTDQQRTIITTLGEAVKAARDAKLQPPAIAVFGDVVTLRKRTAWFERKQAKPATSSSRT